MPLGTAQMESAPLHNFPSLPHSIQARILTYLRPEELSALSQSLDYWEGVENDAALKRIWLGETVPAQLNHLLFDKNHNRPDLRELVRINIVKGVGVVSALQRSGCWTSREAVQISHLHATISRNYLELSLSRRLSPHTRPTPSDLRDLGFLHSSSTFAASLIQARAYDLERLRKKQEVKRMLEQGRIGRSLAEVMYGPAVADGTPRASSCSPSNRNVASLWDDASAAVVAALCPDIKQKKRFWEALAHEQALKTV